MLWLKRLDWISKIIPSNSFLRIGSRATLEHKLCIVRPGGLGDLVLLTRACIELGINPAQIHWILEKRNAPWARYLNLAHECYDMPGRFTALVSGKRRFPVVINSEQHHGLAALFCSRLVARNGCLIGFESNIRSDLYDSVIAYDPSSHERDTFSLLITEARKHIRLEMGYCYSPSPVQQREESPYVVVALAGLQSPEKKLTHSAWRKLIRRAKSYAEAVFLTGTARDQAFAHLLLQAEPGNVANLVGQLPFEQTIDLIRGTTRLLSVDSGLVHVADFFGVPSDVVFASSSSKKWGPRVAGSIILNHMIEEAKPVDQ